ncbi:BadF/BadG/BcrA/BcrD ATPase family protein [Paracoccus zhejiangensis]|uniref:ATPase n=1 Tax=Paracoccus zhejiangensis TaxID=1077935 RepID=A0A2H5EZ67_9RHOB|nr:BadF/BadG/BcrA/BcrD ATPase family protein [Paracoccus zhejiangensis]AUH64584.1 ATPase [Paracoccus zhejiangensis]
MPITKPEPALFALALDGGGSGCRALLVDPAGQVIGRGEGGPANVNSDRQGALTAILAACDQALAGRAEPGQVAAVLGLAGAEVSGARDWLTPHLPFARVRVVQDAVTATMGALGGADGIVAAIGTGSVFSRQIGGETTVIGGRGPILGDQASGNWLGRQLLAHALEAADGLHPVTPLVADLLAQMGGISGIITFAASARAADFATHAPMLMERADDPAALTVLSRADAGIAAFIDRLQPEVPLPVAFSGGLGAGFARRLAGRWTILDPKGSPLDGALRMARDLAGH